MTRIYRHGTPDPVVRRELSEFIRAEWNTESGVLKLIHVNSKKDMILTPLEQINFVKLMEEIVAKDLRDQL